ncbi:MAG: ParB/RepB/Spo0J family partition protein, partial [Acidobacteriota bacterium]
MNSIVKKGAGIRFVLPPEAVTPEPSASPETDEEDKGDLPLEPRGGVANIAMAVTLGREVRQQFEAQKSRLAEYEKAGTGLVDLDPRRVRASRYANRHEASFSTAEFKDFKADLKESGGNLVPVKVRPIEAARPGEPDFELIYGHRRHRAALEEGLPLRAIVQAVDDKKLFVDMDRENRGRASLSVWEQGVMYLKALNDGLFGNQKVLAAELGLSEAVVSRAISIGSLPQEVVASFSAPVVLSYRMGLLLVDAVAKDSSGVMRRAAGIFVMNPKPDDSHVLRLLLSQPEEKPARAVRTSHLLMGKKKVGRVAVDAVGGLVVEIKLSALAPKRRESFIQAIE